MKKRSTFGPVETFIITIGIVAIIVLLYSMSATSTQSQHLKINHSLERLGTNISQANLKLVKSANGDSSINFQLDILTPIEESNASCQKLIGNNSIDPAINHEKLKKSVLSLCQQVNSITDASALQLEEKDGARNLLRDISFTTLLNSANQFLEESKSINLRIIEDNDQKINYAYITLLVGLILVFAAVSLFFARTRTTLDAASVMMEESMLRNLTVLDNNVDAIITIDSQGLIEAVNPMAERMFGYGIGELVGQNVSRLMPEKYQSQHSEFIHKYVQTGEGKVVGQRKEFVGVRKDGSQFPMELAVSPLMLGEVLLFTGIIREIKSSAKPAEEASEAATKTQNALATIVNNLPGAVVILRLDRELSVEFISRACAEITGYKASEFIGQNKKPFAGLIYEQDMPKVKEHIQTAYTQKKPFQFDFILKTADGHTKNVLMQGVITAGGAGAQPVMQAYMQEFKKKTSVS